MHLETDVLVVGGGCTGTGVARDLALRGLRVVLAEKDDLAAGTSGRNHGLLHSGGRYAVKDPEAAAECIAENRILRRIASHCIWDAGGLFVALEEDDPAYVDTFIESCRRLGIEAEEVDRGAILHEEPNLPKDLARAVRVPDGCIDPFSLCLSNAQAAADRGAEVRIHHALVGLRRSGAKLVEATLQDQLSGERVTVVPRMVVNAAGAWAGEVGRLVDVPINVILSKGSLLVTSHRLVKSVVNRCRPPASGDILVPGGPVTLLGTTSIATPDPSDTSTADEEVALLRQEAAKLVPAAAETRVLRAFAGVRPLYQPGGSAADGRAVTRGHAVIDHAAIDGLEGLVTIVGGKLTTYRKMAEDVSDFVCRRLGVEAACRTAELPLPGAEPGAEAEDEATKRLDVSPRTIRMARIRHGHRAEQVLAEAAAEDPGQLGHVCLCESVTEAEVRHAARAEWARTTDDVRRRTRAGCGPCQGTYCGPRVSSVLAEELCATVDEERELADAFSRERRRGVEASMQGPQLVQEALRQAVARSTGDKGSRS